MPRTAKQMQQTSIEPPPPQEEAQIRITACTDVGFKYHLTFPASVIRDLLDPDIGDAYLEIPIPPELKDSGIKHHYLHTTRIAELYIHDELPPKEAEKPGRKVG
jgi:hypothetical protein